MKKVTPVHQFNGRYPIANRLGLSFLREPAGREHDSFVRPALHRTSEFADFAASHRAGVPLALEQHFDHATGGLPRPPKWRAKWEPKRRNHTCAMGTRAILHAAGNETFSSFVIVGWDKLAQPAPAHHWASMVGRRPLRVLVPPYVPCAARTRECLIPGRAKYKRAKSGVELGRCPETS